MRHTSFVVAPVLLAMGALFAAGAERIAVQKAAEEILAAHKEITGLEIAAARSEREGCKTVAATEPNEIGQKCDKDELTAIKTNKPFVEHEKEEFDVTLPIHDASGKIIATAGMDFKESGQTKEAVVRQARVIAAEIEKRFTSKEQMFEAAP